MRHARTKDSKVTKHIEKSEISGTGTKKSPGLCRRTAAAVQTVVSPTHQHCCSDDCPEGQGEEDNGGREPWTEVSCGSHRHPACRHLTGVMVTAVPVPRAGWHRVRASACGGPARQLIATRCRCLPVHCLLEVSSNNHVQNDTRRGAI